MKDVFEVLLEGGSPVGVVQQVVFPLVGSGELFLGSVCSPVFLASCLVKFGVPPLEFQAMQGLHFFPCCPKCNARWNRLCPSPLVLEFFALREFVHEPARVGHVLADRLNAVVHVSLEVLLLHGLPKILPQVPRPPQFVVLLLWQLVRELAYDGLVVRVRPISVISHVDTLEMYPA